MQCPKSKKAASPVCKARQVLSFPFGIPMHKKAHMQLLAEKFTSVIRHALGPEKQQMARGNRNGMERKSEGEGEANDTTTRG